MRAGQVGQKVGMLGYIPTLYIPPVWLIVNNLKNMEVKDALYLGDAVYAVFDGYHIWLRLNSHDNTEGQIAIEPQVFELLSLFAKKVWNLTPPQE